MCVALGLGVYDYVQLGSGSGGGGGVNPKGISNDIVPDLTKRRQASTFRRKCSPRFARRSGVNSMAHGAVVLRFFLFSRPVLSQRTCFARPVLTASGL